MYTILYFTYAIFLFINGDKNMQEQKEIERKTGHIYVYSTDNCRPINL